MPPLHEPRSPRPSTPTSFEAVRIRLASPSDGPAVADIYRPAVSDSAISFEIEPPDGSTMAERIRATLERTPWLVVDSHGTVLGYAYATRHRERPAYQWSVDVSVYVHADARRRGVARALYASLFAALALQGFQNAYAGISLPNPASVAMHLAAGFTPVGIYRSVGYKLGRWHDVGWFERRLDPLGTDPLPPTPLPHLSATETFSLALAAGAGYLRG